MLEQRIEQHFIDSADLKYQAAGNKMEWPATGFGGVTQRFENAKPVIAAASSGSISSSSIGS